MDDARRKAFDELVDVRSPSLLRTAYLLTGDWSSAEDLLQSSLAKTWFRWKRLEDTQAGEAYVRQVMYTTYCKWYRRKWRGEISTGYLPDTQASRDDYSRVDDQDGLGRAMAELSAKTRAVIVLRFFEDLTEAQVAHALGCSIGTVKSTTHRGLAKLRESAQLDGPPAQRSESATVIPLHRKEKSA
ncbi:MAG: SigE family RNA polymerase sigma factor [Mycobacteriales bacterium]